MNTQSNLFTNKGMGKPTVFSAPLGDLKQGHLEITHGISHFELTGDSSTRDLFHGQFIGLIPSVHTRHERVIIHYRLSIAEWIRHALFGNQHAGKVTLNGSLPWQIDIQGGVSHLDADLRGLQLSSLTITGGISQAEILLPRPQGTVQIHVASGVSNLKIFRPQGVPGQLKVGGGASNLIFDDQLYGSIGGRIQLTAPGYQAETNRYDIRVNSGVSNFAVRTLA